MGEVTRESAIRGLMLLGRTREQAEQELAQNDRRRWKEEEEELYDSPIWDYRY